MDTKPGINYPLLAAILLLLLISATTAALVVLRRANKAIRAIAEKKDAEISALSERLMQAKHRNAMLLDLTDQAPATANPATTEAKIISLKPEDNPDPDSDPAA